jgi:hypothetical protein
MARNRNLTPQRENTMSTVWPKRLKPLTPEQLRIKNEWESYWLGEGLTKYSFVEKFNADFFASLKDASPPGQRILEIGPGKGNFIRNYLQPGDKYFRSRTPAGFLQ